jgi:hypothetical protein
MRSDYCSGTDDSEPPGRVLKLVQQHSAEQSSLDDQLPRCLQVLRQIYAMYYCDDDDQPSSIGGNGAIHPVQVQQQLSVQQQPEQKKKNESSTSTSSYSSSSSLNADNNKQLSSVPASAPVTTTPTPLYHNQQLAKRSVATILRGLKREVLRTIVRLLLIALRFYGENSHAKRLLLRYWRAAPSPSPGSSTSKTVRSLPSNTCCGDWRSRWEHR